MRDIIDRELLMTHIVNAFPYCDTHSITFTELASELNKRKIPEKIDHSQCVLTFLHSINYYFSKIVKLDNDDKKHYLKDIPADELNKLSDFIFTTLINIPSQISVTFELGDLIFPECDAHAGIKISTDKKIESLGLFTPHSSPLSNITFNGYGFYSPFSKNDILREYTQKLNIFLYFMIREKVLIVKEDNEFNSPTLYGLGVFNQFNTHIIKKYLAKIIDSNYPSMPYSEILPIGLSGFISKLKINTESEQPLEIAIDLAAEKSSRLYVDSSNESRRIKMAIDWYLTSFGNEDSLMSFLQICMGLEAIFGDDQDQGGLTKMLGDRCAYLIGKNIQQRKNIKDGFNKIYTMRSKIVHGVINKIHREDLHMLSYAKELLYSAIKKELSNLES